MAAKLSILDYFEVECADMDSIIISKIGILIIGGSGILYHISTLGGVWGSVAHVLRDNLDLKVVTRVYPSKTLIGW